MANTGVGRIGAWAPASAMLAATLVGAAVTSLAPVPGQPVAALFPVWWPAPRAFAAGALGGRIVRSGAWPTLLVIAPGTPGAARRLRAAGAWIIVNPQALGGQGYRI